MKAADRLALAAAPVFALMALATGLSGGGPLDAICAPQGPLPVDGMVVMYLLMTAVHTGPWLRLLERRRGGEGGGAPPGEGPHSPSGAGRGRSDRKSRAAALLRLNDVRPAGVGLHPDD